jgi:hypothetical protein
MMVYVSYAKTKGLFFAFYLAITSVIVKVAPLLLWGKGIPAQSAVVVFSAPCASISPEYRNRKRHTGTDS